MFGSLLVSKLNQCRFSCRRAASCEMRLPRFRWERNKTRKDAWIERARAVAALTALSDLFVMQ
jgi:hypothetical protein